MQAEALAGLLRRRHRVAPRVVVFRPIAAFTTFATFATFRALDAGGLVGGERRGDSRGVVGIVGGGTRGDAFGDSRNFGICGDSGDVAREVRAVARAAGGAVIGPGPAGGAPFGPAGALGRLESSRFAWLMSDYHSRPFSEGKENLPKPKRAGP